MRSPEFRSNTDHLIARALREEQEEPPEDFVAQTVAFVLRAPADTLGDRLELWLQRAVLVALIGTVGATLLWMGGRILAGLASVGGAGWIYAVATCMVLSLACQQLMKWLEKRI